MHSYALTTAAFNEAKYLPRLLESIVHQTATPIKWVIVSDGSTDATDDIVASYARDHPFIELLRLERVGGHSFGAQAKAINRGLDRLRSIPYDLVGNLDADISLGPDYFRTLTDRFDANPRLGLAGGCLFEDHGHGFVPRKTNRVSSVPHGVQLFRRECLADIGGRYAELPHGGPDWHAEVTARMRGWEVQSFLDVTAFHHRPTGTAGSHLGYAYRQGLMDYSLGSHPVFEVAKLARRCLISSAPDALVRLAGFLKASIVRAPRPVSVEFVHYLRREQMQRLTAWRPVKSDVRSGGMRASV